MVCPSENTINSSKYLYKMKLCYALVQSQFLHHIRLHLHGTMFVIVIMLSSLLVMSASAEHSNLEQPNEDIGPVINEPFHPRAIVKRGLQFPVIICFK
nr:unnamed protein product [Haemonchus contortus]